jgi:hypothetical protein
LRAKRAPLHAGFAEWLERHGEGEDEHAPLLAHHYAEAVRPEDLDLAWAGREGEAEQLRGRALVWLERAAQLAIGRYEMDEGLSLLHRAVELETDPRRQAALWHRIGRANALKFDGDAFWRAIEQAIELGGPSADLYAELAFQSTRRWGMWRTEPETELIVGWIDRALELAEQDSRSRAWALYARSSWGDDANATEELARVAERRGEPDLESLALEQLAEHAWEDGEVEETRRHIDRLAHLAPKLPDPDDQTRPFIPIIRLRLGLGDLEGAAEAAALNVELVRGLTPHHRLHGAGMQILATTLAGRWEDVAALAPQAERAVDENDTHCPQNITTLLHCALADTLRGDDREARRLEEKAAAKGLHWWRFWIDPPRIRLALARGDLDALPPLVEQDPDWIEPPAAFFDALVALGERERIEKTAPRWIRPGTYTEPFALRALGLVREDETLVEQAARAFDTLGLGWHAQQTRERQVTGGRAG